MTIQARSVSAAAAFTLVLFAVDLPLQVIDAFGLAVPRQLFGVSWFAGLPILVLLALWPLVRASGYRLVARGDGLFLVLLLGWLAIGAWHGPAARSAGWLPVMTCLPPWLAWVVGRAHLRAFSDRQALVRAFVLVAVTIAIAQLCALLLVRAGVFVSFLNPDEIVDRNSVSLLPAVAVLLYALDDHAAATGGPWLLVALVALGFVHAELNHARAAELVLVLVAGLQLVRVVVSNRRVVFFLCALGSVAMVAGMIFVHPILLWMVGTDSFGESDAAVSIFRRTASNWQVVNLFLESPVTGAGWERVMQAQSGTNISHTLYLLWLGAYGWLGTLPLLALVLVWLRLADPSRRLQHGMTLFVLVVVASFFNDPLAWFGVVLALAATPGPSARAPGQSSGWQRSPISATDLAVHARRAAWVGAGVSVVLLLGPGTWLARRDGSVAMARLEIAQIGTYRLEAVEAPREAQTFVEREVLRHDSDLGRACSVRGMSELPVVLVRCRGGGPEEARRKFDRVLEPLLRRHQELADVRGITDGEPPEIDRRRLATLDALLADLDRRLAASGQPSPGISSLRAAMADRRVALARDLDNVGPVRSRHHPTRVDEAGVQIQQRTAGPALWMALFVCAMLAGLAAAVAVGCGRALQEAAVPALTG